MSEYKTDPVIRQLVVDLTWVELRMIRDLMIHRRLLAALLVRSRDPGAKLPPLADLLEPGHSKDTRQLWDDLYEPVASDKRTEPEPEPDIKLLPRIKLAEMVRLLGKDPEGLPARDLIAIINGYESWVDEHDKKNGKAPATKPAKLTGRPAGKPALLKPAKGPTPLPQPKRAIPVLLKKKP